MTQPPSFYEIDLKQGDLLIQLISDDATFISRQMARWFELLVDERTAPVAIRPGLPFLAPPVAPPPVQPQPVAVMASPPPAPVVDDSQTQLLMAQIQLLQSQVQNLTQQVSHAAQPVAPTPPPVLEAPPVLAPQPEPVPVEPEPLPVAPIPQPEPAVVEEPPVLEPPVFQAPLAPEPQPELPVLPLPEEPETLVPALVAEPEPIPSEAPPVPSGADELDLDVFAAPAHVDFGPMEASSPPVNNLAQTVDNLPEVASTASVETQAPLSLMDIPLADATPVENPSAPVAELDEFDALLSSILTDVSEIPPSDAPVQSAVADTPVLPASGVAGALFDVPETPFVESPSAQVPAVMEPSPVTNLPVSGVAGALFDMPEESPFESALEAALETQPSLPPEPTAPSLPVSGVAGALFDTPEEESPFESALESALGQLDHTSVLPEAVPTPAPAPINIPLSGMAGALFDEPESEAVDADLATAFAPMDSTALGMPTEPEGPVYTPPNVNYDFGIPLPAPPLDPKVRQLNLDSLQITPPEGAPFDSPFPQVDSDEAASAPVHDAFALEGEAELGALQVETFQDLCDLAPQAASGQDFLILSAFFLSKMQQAEKYALKDLNSHLMRAGLTPVNHSVLEQVMGQGLLQLVPDLTGTASTAEYRLTDQGEARASELIQA